MRFETIRLADIHPYGNNPRRNDDAVNAVAESIRQCTYIAPVIIDEDHVILAGHTRYKALLALGIEEVP
ncbi:MAG: ParB N-terminal domain-containing protein [Bullifex sp.]|nr:ParB N-terminal domain-containing protein [Bullifex sp.]